MSAIEALALSAATKVIEIIEAWNGNSEPPRWPAQLKAKIQVAIGETISAPTPDIKALIDAVGRMVALPCEYCGHDGPCENCMNTGSRYPELADYYFAALKSAQERAALSSAPSATAVPVAWRYRPIGPTQRPSPWVCRSEKPNIPADQRESLWEIEPLYAAAPSPDDGSR